MFSKKNTPNRHSIIYDQHQNGCMRKIKGSSSYIKNQVIRNAAKAAFSILIFVAILFLNAEVIFFTGQTSVYRLSGLVFLILPLVAFNHYLHKYHVYNGGWWGEKQVDKQLASNLSDDYYLINDLYLPESGGDIDHIVLAPGGVFVLETKNWSGNVICQGDTWQRPGKRAFNVSPSNQVKHNAAKVRRIIENSPALPVHIWVEGIVVLTNRNATINLNNPSVTVLGLVELPNYILARGGSRMLSAEQLEVIGKEIVSQKA